MVVRRSPGKMIKIVHLATGQTFEMKILDVDTGGHEGRPRVLTEFTYASSDYSAQARLFENCTEYPSAVYMHRNGEIYLRNSSGDDMTIQVIKVAGSDVNFRLVDPTRKFEFQWSDNRLTT